MKKLRRIKKVLSFQLSKRKFFLAFFFNVFIFCSLLSSFYLPSLPLLFKSKSFYLNFLFQEKFPEEKSLWYVIKLGEVPAGYAREQTTKVMTPQGPIIKSISEVKIKARRLGAKIELFSHSEVEETEKGQLLRLSLTMKLSTLETKTQVEVGEKEIIVCTSVGDKEYTQKIDINERLLGPEGIVRLTLRSLKKPGDEVEYLTYLPEINQIIKGKRKAESWEEISLPGFFSSFKTLRVLESLDPLTTKRTLWFDQEGKLIKSEETSPLGELKIYLSSKEEALAVETAQEINEIPFESTLIRSNIRLPKARSIEKIKLRLSFKRGEASLPPFTGFYQRVISFDKNSLILEVEKPVRPIKQKTELNREKQEEKENLKAYLQANSYLNIDDPLIQKTAKELTSNLKSDWEKVIRLRDWVSQKIKFDPGIVFAPSTEVIREKRGTCVSFAILLTALARACGLPARFVMGYAYLNGVWGGHAWSEIYVDGTWLPFDSALPSLDVADAARIALVASSLNQGVGEVIMAGQLFFSQIDIQILEYQLDGRMFKAPPKIYEIKERKYINFGLGLTVNQIDSLAFAELNKAWPDNTILVMRNGKEEVRLLQQVWRPVENLENYLRQIAGPDFDRAKVETFIYHGEKAYRLKNKNQAVAFFFQGTDLWQIHVRSDEASDLLAKALRAIQFRN